MRWPLKPHPDSPCAAVSGVTVEVERTGGGLELRYQVKGVMADLRLPPGAEATRADGLWRHTCFEAFVGVSPQAGYYEFNFAPSGQWAAYRFAGYRSGMTAETGIAAPRVEGAGDSHAYELQASLELVRLPGARSDAIWRLGLAAVIEERDGRRSYWALAHPPGHADFHHGDGFVVELGPSGAMNEIRR